MAHKNMLTIDGFQCGIEERILPKVGDDGLPNGETIAVKVLIFDDSGLHVEIIFTHQDWEAFQKNVSGKSVIVTSQMPPPPVV